VTVPSSYVQPGAAVMVVGLGVSGIAVIELLRDAGARVTAVDDRGADDIPGAETILASTDVHLLLGEQEAAVTAVEAMDLIVVSPGVRASHPILRQALHTGIRVVSELELAGAACPAPLVTITGTNGKSSTTTMIGQVLNRAGRTVHVGGNIGIPLAALVNGIAPDDIAVVEVSVQQLENTAALDSLVTVVTNLRPEHMDRYTSFQEYLSYKTRLVRFQPPTTAIVLNDDDPVCRAVSSEVAAPFLVSSQHGVPNGVSLLDGVIHLVDGGRVVASAPAPPSFGTITTARLLALISTVIMGVSFSEAVEHISGFTGLEHAMELCADVAGVRYYNDSKATNHWATVYALTTATGGETVLIAGGKDDKNADFRPLARAAMEHAKWVVLIGQTASRISQAMLDLGCDRFTRVDSLPAAVDLAATIAVPGDRVLFSPGGNSRDMFPSHRHRGRQFKDLVRHRNEQHRTPQSNRR
jgi:UDP-N-acetylmuramoylalanine--D-glutamate ligase